MTGYSAISHKCLMTTSEYAFNLHLENEQFPQFLQIKQTLPKTYYLFRHIMDDLFSQF